MVESERHKQMKGRNYTIAGILFALVILFFVVSIVKMQGAG